MKTAIQKTIMRRVYYSYALSFLTNSMLWQGFVLGASIALFGRMTHVAAIARNLAETRVEQAPSFIVNNFIYALTHGEFLTALVVLFMVGLTTKFFLRAVPLLFKEGKVQVA